MLGTGGSIPIFSVTEISFFIKDILENSFPFLKVVGEVSNYTKYQSSGHIYFSLKDSQGLIKVVCFKEKANAINFTIEDGMKVTVTGKISAYSKSSNYQIIATNIEKSGIGELAKLLEELKIKLLKEGVFDEKHKKPLPFLPSKIGLITSASGAVMHDIIRTLDNRFPRTIILYDSPVQGANAAKKLIAGIKAFNSGRIVDIIIVARGGGSFEDLFEFNDEALVRAAFSSKIPIISAVGHETDFTLLDMVADRRAATPTASVIMVVPSREDLMINLDKIITNCVQYAIQRLANIEAKLEKIVFEFLNIARIVEENLFILERRFQEAIKHALHNLQDTEKKLEKIYSEILFFDFTEVLSRGFAIILNSKQRRVVDSTTVKSKDKIHILLQEDQIDAIVI